MRTSRPNRQSRRETRSWKAVIFGGTGIVLGGVFLALAVRHIDPADLAAALQRVDRDWLIAAVVIYLGAIGLRCMRWGVLLRATDSVKWRHAAEALLTGFAANYILPGRVGELFRADYARRVFNMSRFTSLGTIVVERVFDGILLVCMLWSSFAWVFFTRLIPAETSWILLLGAAASVLFSAALVFVFAAQQIDLGRFGVPPAVATRWDRLVKGISSVLRGKATTVVLYTIEVWILEVVALTCMVRSFGVSLAPPEILMLLSLASLSTLLPTAPAYVGTYQLVFGHVFRIFGYQQTIGIVAATAVQIFCFGTVTIIGGLVLLSRGGIMIWRANRWAPPKDRFETRAACGDKKTMSLR